jgi:hypothetical protein
MAKMFYTLDEAKAALGKNEEEIKQFAREGRLREFRDGPRLMFKADQVETLRTELAEGAEPAADLGPSDSGSAMAIGLTDSHGMSGTGLTLVDESGRSPGAGMTLKEDTALAADLGLSGSVGGMPSPAKSGAGSSAVPSAPSASGINISQGSKAGIDVFQNDEIDRVDPSAQTSVSPSGHDSDQMNIEAVGSGSGLLDLTKESDDTSLGAELLDEIAPSSSGTNMSRKSASGTAAVGASGSMAGMSGTRSVAGVGVMSRNSPNAPPVVITYIEKPDPLSAAFGAAALGATIFVIFGAFALITGVLDTSPTILQTIATYGFLILAGAGVAVAIVFFLAGFVFGKTMSR